MRNFLDDKRTIISTIIAAFLVIILIVILTWGEAIYRTAFILSNIVPGAPKWFELGKYDVQVNEVEFKRPTGKTLFEKTEYSIQKVDIYRPIELKESAFVILFPGFTKEGTKDPRLVNFANSLAEAGIGVAIPQSFTMRNNIFTTNDIDRITDTFKFLQEKAYVERDRIAIMGFSVAGSYVLRAASSLGDRPLFIVSIGAYYNLNDLVVSLMLEKASYKGRERGWKPNPFPKKLVLEFLNENLSPDETDALPMNDGMTVDQFRRINPKLADKLDDLSPSPVLSQIRTKVFILHGKNDGNTPVEDARKIHDGLSRNIPIYYSELSIMNHVTPTTFLNLDFIKFFWQILSILRLLY